MAKLKYTYVVRRRLADGSWKEYWRFRRGDRNSPLPGQPGDAEFFAAYAAILDQEDRVAEKKQAERHTFDWLCDTYLASAEFKALAASTQTDYQRTIDERLKPVLGPERYDSVKRSTVKKIRDSYADQPRTAHKVKQMVSRLYSWAEECDYLPSGFINPALGIRKLKVKAKHIEVWSEEEIVLFLAHAPDRLRTVVLLALYTGQRAEDVATMDWKQVQGLDSDRPMIRVRQSKTDQMLTVPCHSVLRDHLKRIKTTFGGPIARGINGRPTNANALSSAIGRAVADIDAMPTRSLHGLRYAAAGRLEQVGCTVVEITSIIGHRTYQMAMQYMSQRRAAEAAGRKAEELRA